MKFIRFSTFLAVSALVILSLSTSSCRHGSPTGPTDTTTLNDTGCCHGRITLTMTDSATGHALDGGLASLYENDQLVSTKAMSTSGTVWDGLCPGNYHLVVSKDGYQTATFHLDSMGCNGSQTPHHVLDPENTNSGDSCCHGILEITALDSANGEIISGATFAITNRTTGFSKTAVTSNGIARFDGLCPGNYLCSITAAHFTTSTFDFEMTCNDSQTFSKTLAPISANATCDSASITLHVLDSLHQDMNVTGASVTVRIDGHSDNFATGTTTDGGYYYSEHNLPSPDTYIITISKDGYQTKTIHLQIGDCRNYGETVYLSPQ